MLCLLQPLGGAGWGPSQDSRYSCGEYRVGWCRHCGSSLVASADFAHLTPHRAVFVAASCLGNHSRDVVRHAATGACVGDHTIDQCTGRDLTHIDGVPATSSRAEIYAVIHGLELVKNYTEQEKGCEECIGRTSSRHASGRRLWLVATPSDYVVDALTLHWPDWRNNNWTKANGEPVANAKLLQRLYGLIIGWERLYSVDIGLCKVPAGTENPAKGDAVRKACQIRNAGLEQQAKVEQQEREADRAKAVMRQAERMALQRRLQELQWEIDATRRKISRIQNAGAPTAHWDREGSEELSFFETMWGWPVDADEAYRKLFRDR